MTNTFQDIPDFPTNLLNQLEPKKLVQICRRVLAALIQTADVVFTDDEKALLLSSLSIDSDDLHSILGAIRNVFQTAAYNLAKVNTVQNDLMQLGLTEDRATVVAKVWSDEGKKLLETKKRKVIGENLVTSIDYSLNVQIATEATSKEAKPVVMLQLNGPESDFVMEMDHQELSKFYDQLEEIQSQIDQLR